MPVPPSIAPWSCDRTWGSSWSSRTPAASQMPCEMPPSAWTRGPAADAICPMLLQSSKLPCPEDEADRSNWEKISPLRLWLQLDASRLTSCDDDFTITSGLTSFWLRSSNWLFWYEIWAGDTCLLTVTESITASTSTDSETDEVPMCFWSWSRGSKSSWLLSMFMLMSPSVSSTFFITQGGGHQHRQTSWMHHLSNQSHPWHWREQEKHLQASRTAQ